MLLYLCLWICPGGFTDLSKYPVNYTFKAFNKLRLSDEDLLRYISMASNHMTGNPDGDNILFAHNRLIKRKEKRKLLIVISDGMPASSRGSGGESDFTKQVIEDIEKQKNVEIYGLGIMHPGVKDYYKYYSVVTTPEDIPTKLLELIEQKLLDNYV